MPSAPFEFAEQTAQRLSSAAAGSVVVIALRVEREDHVQAVFMEPAAHVRTLALGDALDAIVKPVDCVAFASPSAIWILLANVASDAVAHVAARRMLDTVRKIAAGSGGAIRISAGLASFPEHGVSAAELVFSADAAAQAAMTQADAVAWFDPRRQTKPSQLENQALLEAISQRKLSVFLQPIVQLAKPAAAQAEALLRLPPDLASRYVPGSFVAACEHAGLAMPLLKTVLSSALRHVAELAEQGVALEIAVNVSPAALSDPLLPDIVTQALATWRVPPPQLTLEVTEGSLIENAEQATQTLSALRVRGIGIAIDDFGTGFSSLAYLQRLPLSKLKIDRMFVNDMLRNKSSLAIVRTVIDLAHNFGLTAIAEGVEDGATLAALRSMGIDGVQGFLFSPAVDVKELLEWIRSGALQRLLL